MATSLDLGWPHAGERRISHLFWVSFSLLRLVVTPLDYFGKTLTQFASVKWTSGLHDANVTWRQV